MATPERGTRRGVFGIAPTKESSRTPVLPKPEVVPAPTPEPPKKSLTEHLARVLKNRLVRLGLATGVIGLGAGAYEAYQHDVIPIQSSAENPSAIFDNSKDKGVIGSNNTISKTLQEIQSQFPQQIVAEGSRITFLFPFQLPDGMSASYTRNLSDRLMTVELQKQAESDKVKDNIDFVLPKDTTLIASMDVHVLVAKGRTNAGEDPNMSPMTWLYYYDQSQNITYQLWFFTLDGSGLSPFVEMQEFTPDTARGTNWQKLPNIQQGLPIVATTKDGQQLRLNVKAYWGTIIGPQAEIVDKTVSLVTSQFFTGLSSSGQTEMLALKK